ncbi:MAG: hypothetical protein CME71_08660 [Halobacteriovorax sp.]|nr:hypothetical protein [Halobacteriovorax sp.]|tara:strand:+ start:764 stop:1471 length:708 start_codon:yes stop_codon:yes gene_type:complete
MQQSEFFGELELPSDILQIDGFNFSLSFNKKEVITAWKYKCAAGPSLELEKIGQLIMGATLLEAFEKVSSLGGYAQLVYWQLGRLLGYWQQTAFPNDLVCRCFNVTRSQIVTRIKDHHEIDLLELRKSTRVCAGCTSCKAQVQQLVQQYCDENAVVTAGKTAPKGMNPLDLLLRVDQTFNKWKQQHLSTIELSLKGIKDYTLYASWNDQDNAQVLDFFNQLRVEAKIKLAVERVA